MSILRLKNVSLVIVLSVILTLNSPYQADAGGLVYTSEGNLGGGGTGQIFGVTAYLMLSIIIGGTITYPTRLTRQKNRVDDFYERFKVRPRKIQTELKRRQGKTYRWVTRELLSLNAQERHAFNCLLKKKSRSLDRHLKHAQSLKRPSVDKLTKWLIREGEKSKKADTVCALEGRYLSNPSRFASDLTTFQGPNVEWLLTKHLDRSKVYLKKFQCQLHKLRAPIASAITSLQTPKRRHRGAQKLSALLKGLGKSWVAERCKID